MRLYVVSTQLPIVVYDSQFISIMGRAISYTKRQKIIERRLRGDIFSTIANDLGVSVPGVKKIWYAYQKKGAAALTTTYNNCGAKTRYPEKVRDLIDQLRDNQQGADYIVSKVEAKYPDIPCPSVRTLQRWWQAEGTSLARGRVATAKKKSGVK